MAMKRILRMLMVMTMKLMQLLAQERLWEKDRSRRTAIKRILMLMSLMQERLRQQAIKDAEKERAQFYAKQKEGQKDVRAKYREKVRAVWFCLVWGKTEKDKTKRLIAVQDRGVADPVRRGGIFVGG